MCGIAGKLQFKDNATVPQELVDRMMGAISYRGPDGRGSYLSGPVGLGHARLAIIDLDSGAQPISNEDKSVWLVYNGEIYNFPELREELLKQGHLFRTHSDTEVIVHLYEQYGVECLSKLRGMFAFAIWDEKRQSLLLARDRIGIKPLYFCNTGKALVFGSEIKALLADPEVNCQVDLQSIDKFLTHFCLPGKETLWKNIHKLEPRYYLVSSKGKIDIKQYWDLKFTPGKRWASMEEAAEAAYDLTKKTVRDHMISDVPVGFLLSGGLDSTVVLSCAASETGQKISTFTVGFDNGGFEDERPYARLVSKRFGTAHHEISFSAAEFWDFLPSLVWHMEEPVCDPPAVSLHYISKLARQSVKVLLSGEGGDEAFGGYHSYRNFLFLEKAKAALRPLNGFFPSALSAIGRFPKMSRIGQYSPYAAMDLQKYYYSRVASPFNHFNRTKHALYTKNFQDAVCGEDSVDIVQDLFKQVHGQPLLHQMQYIDTKTSLPEDLLIKADRITMGNSLELRVPFLDHELLEFAAGLPTSYKVNRFATKRILKQAFGNRIPMEIIKRRKAGFPLPLNQWLQRDLKNKVSEVLLSEKSLGRGYFSRSGIEKLLAQSEAGTNLSKEIFSLLTLELLHTQFIDR